MAQEGYDGKKGNHKAIDSHLSAFYQPYKSEVSCQKREKKYSTW